MTFARLLNELKWTAPEGTKLGHDDFDAALCAITGVSDRTARLEKAALEKVIRERLELKTKIVPQRFDAPKGYVLLTQPPKGVTVNVRKIADEEEMLSAIFEQSNGCADLHV